jgi:hypothetical protein
VARRERESARQATESDLRGHVTLNAQNHKKLGRSCPWQSLVSAGDAQRERERLRQEATGADFFTSARDIKCAEPHKTRPPSYAPAIRYSAI